MDQAKPEQTLVERAAEFGLLLLIFFLPLQTRWVVIEGQLNGGWWEYGTVSVYAIDLLVFAVLACALARVALEQRRLSFTVSQWLGLLLVVIAFFSIAFAGNDVSGLFWFAKLAEGVALLLLLPALRLHQTWLAGAAIASGVAQSLLALAQFVTQTVSTAPGLGMASQQPWDLGVQVVSTESERILRAYGSLPHPNMLAGWLLVAAVVGLVAYLSATHSRARLSYAVALPLLGSGLWFTFSRQAWIALAIIVAVVVTATFVREKGFPRQMVAGLTYLLLPLVILTLGFPDLVSTRLGGASTNERLEVQSVSERQDYLTESVDLLRTEWVTGVGIGNYTAKRQKLDETQGVELPSYAYQPVHNHLFLLFTELGLFGLLTFILLLLGLPQAGLHAKPWAMGWGLALLGLLIIGLFDHYLWSLHFGILLFWLVTALFLQAQRQRVLT